MSGDQDWVPAFEGQRPPFQPGHELTLTHGAYSDRKVLPVARLVVEELLADPGAVHLQATIWRGAVDAYGRAQARVLLMTKWLEEHETGGVTSEGDVLPVVRALKDWESRVERHRRELGLTPLARARLGRDVAQGRAADAAAELTRMREEHTRAGQDDGQGGDE